MKKVTIVGAGAVGASAAFSLAELSIADEVVIVDINRERAKGIALDIAHGVPLIKPVQVYEGDYSDSANSDLVVITVGVPEVVGESRLVPMQKNTEIIKSIVPQILKYSPGAFLLVVSNPVDILTYVAQKVSNLPKGRVLGLGTVLDSSRLKYLLSRDFHVDARSIQSYVIGEHGDSQLTLWSKTSIAGVPVEQFSKASGVSLGADYKEQLDKEVKQTAFDVWQWKGPNCYCVAHAIKTVVESIFRNERSILPVSSCVDGLYGLQDVALSLPSIVGAGGMEIQLELPLSDLEEQRLKASAQLLKDWIQQLSI